MKDWKTLSSVELGALIQQLYLRLEQYEFHAASLAEGSHDSESASALVARLRRRVEDLSALLDHRIAESIGMTEAVRADTSVNTQGRVGFVAKNAS